MSTYGTDPVLVSTRYSRTNTGTSRIEVWEGTSDGLNTVLSSLASWQQWDWDDSEQPKYRLTVRTPEPGDSGVGGSQASVAYDWSWELVGSEVSMDIRQHPRTLWLADDDAGKELLKRVVAASSDPDEVPFIPDGLDSDKTQSFRNLYDLLVKGQNSFAWPSYTLRITLTVSPTFTGGTSDDGDCRVWSSAGIINYYAGYPPTDRIRTRMNNLQAANPYLLFGLEVPAAAGYLWGWLAGPTTETELPDKRNRLQREFKLDFWNTGYIYVPYQ